MPKRLVDGEQHVPKGEALCVREKGVDMKWTLADGSWSPKQNLGS